MTVSVADGSTRGNSLIDEHRRVVTLYDAVASRANHEGFIRPKCRKTEVRSRNARPADEVLGRRRHALQKGNEYREVKKSCAPGNDIMTAIHRYSMEFYHASGMDDVSNGSMDESALLAIGVLLEETIHELLSQSGHMALIDRTSTFQEDKVISNQ
ncbi:hypothetical protein EDC01DRAFT_209662 [Geopyxis carbonaria]|nr:hypothetical protein EDC01DRAFT_209662 [Geopyxis carbonaria]